MTVLTVQEITRTSAVPSFIAATAAGDSFANDGRTYIEVVNGLVDVNVTIVTEKVVGGNAVADDAVL